ncbi:hypothetical protein [Nocardia sp. NPDC127526]|uniref:hypothetical protein n=1 Tax=Nocardia sp. NPDC127526 TaxID=3345393 RepID=UPI00363564CD
MSGTAARDHTRGTMVRIALRLVLILVATAVAFWDTWLRLIQDVHNGSSIGYVYVLIALAALAAAGILLRRGRQLPIHDRQTDVIVGGMLLGMAVAVQGLLMPRYRYFYDMLHLDLLAAWLFLFGAAVLVFGLRPVWRFWPSWLLLLAAFPVPYRLLRTALGGDAVQAGVALLPLAAFAAAIGVGRTRKRALIGAVGVLVIGGLVLAAIHRWRPWWPVLAYQAIPSLVGCFVMCLVMYISVRRGGSMKPIDRPLDPLTAHQVWSGVATVAVIAAALAFLPIPKDYDRAFPLVPGLNLARPHTVPPGWTLLGERDFDWAKRYFGSRSDLNRHLIRAENRKPEWDKDLRRRRVMVDVMSAPTGHDIDKLPEFVLYTLNQPRIGPAIRVDLGNGVVGRMNTVLDDRQLLSWTWLSWNWRDEYGAERVSLIAADNHLPDAEFPQPHPAATGVLDNVVNIFFRGSAVVLDSDPDPTLVDTDAAPKDAAMLTELAREMVRVGTGRS